VLGYSKLSIQDKEHFEVFFKEAGLVQITDAIIREASRLRQQRKMSVADAIIAATALVHGFTLATRNLCDFQGIPGLKLLNPFDSRGEAAAQTP
jgi:predicted nucleic acid-binding protein